MIILKEAPNEPQTLYLCDPMECMHFLFQNPDFDGDIAYVPSWVYPEMTMANKWHFQQVSPNHKSSLK
jgi:hypothetical protein